MPDYIAITDASIDPDAPLTSELMYALRDNPAAIAQGADGAPRLRPGAYNSAASSSTSTGYRVFPLWSNTVSFTKEKFFACIGSGSVRISSGVVTVATGSGSLIVELNGNFMVAAGNGASLNYVLNFNNNDLVRIVANNAGVENVQMRTALPSLPMIPWVE